MQYFDQSDDQQFAVLKQEFFGGIRPFVPLASVFSAACRCGMEAPVEYAKVMGQTNQKWELKNCYRGFTWQVLRTTGLLIPIFTIVDVTRRKTDLFSTFLGTFSVTCGASAISYFVCWPLETLKNLAQSGTPHGGASISQRIAFLGGPLGLYKGVTPGVVAGGLRNGVAMITMIYAQKLATRMGLRE